MKFNELLAAAPPKTPGQSNPTPPKLMPPVPPADPNRPLYTPPFRAGEASLQYVNPTEAYLGHGRQYAEKYSVGVVLTLEEALRERAKLNFVVTLREADIAARMGLPLEGSFFRKALICFGNLLTEGLPGEPDGAYQLRSHYNRGIRFKSGGTQSDYAKSSAAKQQQADAKFKEILEKLAAISLPAWPEEVTHGFSLELCKPEYMTQEQYQRAIQQVTR